MDDYPGPATAPRALDRVAAVLAELGPETATAIARRAGVGYSTATKRLRVLKETGQAEAFRSDDGRTLWRTAAGVPRGIDTTPATTTDAEGGPPHASTPADADDNSVRPNESPVPSRDADTAAPPDERPTRTRTADVRRSAPGNDAGRPNPQDLPRQQDGTLAEPAATAPEGDDTVAAATETLVAAETTGEPERGRIPALASTDGSVAAGGQAEDPKTAAGESTPRRSWGTLRGAVRDVLEAHPDQSFRTGQLCRAIDRANEGTGSAKASAGAVVNAVYKLVTDGVAVQVSERPAAFRLASTTR